MDGSDPVPDRGGGRYLGEGGEPARTAVVLYGAMFLLVALSFGGLFAWVTRDDRLLGQFPPPEDVRAARIRFMIGAVGYRLALALAFVSPLLALGLHGATALYYAFDQASVPSEPAPGDRDPPGRRPGTPTASS